MSSLSFLYIVYTVFIKCKVANRFHQNGNKVMSHVLRKHSLKFFKCEDYFHSVYTIIKWPYSRLRLIVFLSKNLELYGVFKKCSRNMFISEVEKTNFDFFYSKVSQILHMFPTNVLLF